VLVVDDEPLARLGIRQLIARHPGFVVVGEARNGREALRLLGSEAPDLVFLDVQMPELDGFGVIRLRGLDRMPAVVFVTAYDAYAVRAFETHAVDYLVKPVTEVRFTAALARVRERLAARDAVALRERLQALLAEGGGPGAEPAAQRLAVPTTKGTLLLDVTDIDWIAADDYYAEVYVQGKRHLLRESLSSLAARLDPACFVRVHRSAIVNVERARELRSVADKTVVVLSDGTEISVSRRRKEAITSAVRRLRRRMAAPPTLV
jgi:two-component system LytT family response regulator